MRKVLLKLTILLINILICSNVYAQLPSGGACAAAYAAYGEALDAKQKIIVVEEKLAIQEKMIQDQNKKIDEINAKHDTFLKKLNAENK